MADVERTLFSSLLSHDMDDRMLTGHVRTELNFLACQLATNYWQIDLQTGSDAPASGTCSNYQTLHLPCLC